VPSNLLVWQTWVITKSSLLSTEGERLESSLWPYVTNMPKQPRIEDTMTLFTLQVMQRALYDECLLVLLH